MSCDKSCYDEDSPNYKHKDCDTCKAEVYYELLGVDNVVHTVKSMNDTHAICGMKIKSKDRNMIDYTKNYHCSSKCGYYTY